MISYEAIREFEFNDTKKIIPNDGKYQNGLLSNLKSDTFYAVTVYGVNSYGNGDRGKILEVKTLKPSKPGTCSPQLILRRISKLSNLQKLKA